MMNLNYVEITGLILFLIGIYGLVTRKNIMKSILSICIMDIGIITFFLGIRYESGMNPPIGEEISQELMADPVPQALMITAIVIGVAVTAVALRMFTAIYHRYGSTNWDKAFRIRREEQKK